MSGAETRLKRDANHGRSNGRYGSVRLRSSKSSRGTLRVHGSEILRVLLTHREGISVVDMRLRGCVEVADGRMQDVLGYRFSDARANKGGIQYLFLNVGLCLSDIWARERHFRLRHRFRNGYRSTTITTDEGGDR
jgi:hypothetical protein